VLREDLRLRRRQDPVGKRHQVRLLGRKRRAGAAVGGHGAYLRAWMREQQPEQLASGIPAGPCDGDRQL
jgi:hypothetical protein